MNPKALAQECIRAITQQPGCPFIVVIGKLAQRGWPRGKCVGSDSRGRFYAYDAYELLGRLIVYGVASIQPLETDGSAVEILNDSKAGASTLGQTATVKVYQVMKKVSRRI